MRKAIEEAKKFVCTTKDRIVKDAKEFIQNVDWKKVASGAFMWGAIGGAVGGGTTEVFKDVGSNVLGKVGKKLVEDGADMALDLTQTATENGGLTGKDVLFSAVTSFGGDLVGAAKTNSTARNQLIDGAFDNFSIFVSSFLSFSTLLLSIEEVILGIAIDIITPSITITTNNSTKVNPFLFNLFILITYT